MFTKFRVHLPLIMLLVTVGVVSGFIGYYWGRKFVAEDFVNYCGTEALADRIAASLYARYGSDSQDDEDTTTKADPAAEEVEDAETEDEEGEEPDQDVVLPEGGPSSVAGDASLASEALYEAQLAGFGSESSAEHYLKKLRTQSIAAHVRKRTTRTARGRTSTWYQVVTNPLSYSEASNLVTRLKEEDHLKGVVLVEVTR